MLALSVTVLLASSLGLSVAIAGWFVYRVLAVVSQARNAHGKDVSTAEIQLEKLWWLLTAVPAFAFASLLALGIAYREDLVGAGAWGIYRVLSLPAAATIWVAAFWLYLYGAISISRARRPIQASEPSRSAAFEALRRTAWLAGMPVLLTVVLLVSKQLPITLQVLTIVACLGLGPIVYARAAVHLLPVRTLEDPRLRAGVLDLASRAGVAFGAVLEVRDEDGDESTDGERNAMALGWGRSRKILITSALIRSLARSETLAIVAHECAHLRRHHVLKQTAFIVLFWLGVVATNTGLSHFFPGSVAELIPVALALSGVVLFRRYQRQQEAEADALAADWVGPQELAGALEALLEEERPARFLGSLQGLLATHPSKVERLRLLKLRLRHDSVPG